MLGFVKASKKKFNIGFAKNSLTKELRFSESKFEVTTVNSLFNISK